MYYWNDCYTILYPTVMRRRIQAIDKTYAFLSVMTVCRNAFDNGVMAYMLQIHESTIHITFVACIVLMEAIFPCFNIKPDNWNLATSLLVYKLSHLHKTFIVRTLWLKFDEISPIGMELMFSKIHPGSMIDFNITEENSMLLAGFSKKNIKDLSSKMFLVSNIFLKIPSQKNNPNNPVK